MTKRTFAIGDLHGDIDQLLKLMERLPRLTSDDRLVFLGDYVDRGPCSAEVVEYVRKVLPDETPAEVIALLGNHEDAWLRVRERGFPEFIMPRGNGALETMRSYRREPPPGEDDVPRADEFVPLFAGDFFPPEHLEWFAQLPHWYEDEHAIYVHAGLPQVDGKFIHPRDVENKNILLWLRTESFFTDYRGKRVIVGHTTTDSLPAEFSAYTPADPTDLWAGEAVCAIDTGCGKGGFLTALELPALRVYESR